MGVFFYTWRSQDWEDPLEKEMKTHSSILAWKSHGQRSLVGYSPWGCLDMTEGTQHACWRKIGYLIPYSCLENPKEREAGWNTTHGLTELDTTE